MVFSIPKRAIFFVFAFFALTAVLVGVVRIATVRGNLDPWTRYAIASFLYQVYPKVQIPKSMHLEQVPTGNKEQEQQWVGGWQDGEFFYSVLYIRDIPTGKFKYLRTWVLFPDADENAPNTGIFQTFFNQGFIAQFQDTIGCNDQTSLETGEKQTVCGSLVSAGRGEKYGVMLAHPYTTPAGDRAVSVAACLIPHEGVPIYPGTVCL